jgi:hypothetical protein
MRSQYEFIKACTVEFDAPTDAKLRGGEMAGAFIAAPAG